MPKYIVEFLGTYFLALAIGCTAIPATESALVPALGIAAVLAAVIYAGGHVSRAHYNPAITLAFRMCGKCDARDVAPYIAAQLAGALLAATTARYLVGAGIPLEIEHAGRALVAEVVFTFALAWVILNVAIARGTTGNGFYGIAIGLVVAGAILAVGDVSGAALNPAVAGALVATSLLSASDVWIPIVGSIAGAALAAVAFVRTERTSDGDHDSSDRSREAADA